MVGRHTYGPPCTQTFMRTHTRSDTYLSPKTLTVGVLRIIKLHTVQQFTEWLKVLLGDISSTRSQKERRNITLKVASKFNTLCFQSTDGSPTLPELQRFPVKDKFKDIVAEIQNDYEQFGIRLLEDSNGVRIKGIEKSNHGDTVAITVEILRQWLQGKGRTPVTWRTFVECLRESGLNVLANDIEAELGGSKHPPQQQQPTSDSSKCSLPDFMYSFSNCGVFVSF